MFRRLLTEGFVQTPFEMWSDCPMLSGGRLEGFIRCEVLLTSTSFLLSDESMDLIDWQGSCDLLTAGMK